MLHNQIHKNGRAARLSILSGSRTLLDDVCEFSHGEDEREQDAYHDWRQAKRNGMHSHWL